MAPGLAPSTLYVGASSSSSSSPQPRSHRGGHEDRSGAGRRVLPERAASFHARTTPALAPEHRLIRRPKTQPNLLGPRGAWSGASTPPLVPAKVLVNVTLQRSLGPLQVMASTDWTVGDLVAAAVQRYLKEGRRPPLPTADPPAYELHYSQFSLECLDPKEKLIGLGSRNFFLCLKPAPEITEAAGEAATSSATATGSCSKQARRASKPVISWLSFMDCLLS